MIHTCISLQQITAMHDFMLEDGCLVELALLRLAVSCKCFERERLQVQRCSSVWIAGPTRVTCAYVCLKIFLEMQQLLWRLLTILDRAKVVDKSAGLSEPFANPMVVRQLQKLHELGLGKANLSKS
eukprot:6441647-Amphidinium_carterae.2